MELSRFVIATCKRTALNTKSLRNKRTKLLAKIEGLQKEVDVINVAIEGFEAPIKELTGGLTSEQVLEELAKEAPVEENKEAAESSNNDSVENTESNDEQEVAEDSLNQEPSQENLDEENN